VEATLRNADTNSAIGCVVLFGHNQLAEITINRTGKRADRDATFGHLGAILASSPKVVGYLCGHLHSGSPAVKHNVGGRIVKEIIVPAVQEFPKSFGVGRIDKLASGQYEIAVEYFNIEDVTDLSTTRPV